MTAGLWFLDSSAVTKLVVEERESAALAELVAGGTLVGSALLVPEVTRAVRRAVGHDHDATLTAVLDLISLVTLDQPVLRLAAELPPPGLRTLDALHLASALSLGDRLTGFVAYDDRLLSAARRAGLPAQAP